MAMATYDIMPPPTAIGGGLGEVRTVNYTGCGIALGDEIDMTESGSWAQAPEDQRLEVLTKTVYDSVMEQYAMIEGCMGTGSEFAAPVSCERPWKK